MSTSEQRRKHTAYMRQWRRDNPEKWRAICKRYTQTHREQHNECARKYRKRHVEKKKAQNVVSHAIRDGVLIRPSTCSKCHEICIPEAHHEKYDEPLNIIWLCFNCHRKVGVV